MTAFLTVVTIVVTITVSAALGAPLVGWLLRRIEPNAQTPGVLRGGTWIGILERVAITGAILAGYGTAVAVVIAIKGLGRYPELRDTPVEQRPQTTERFIIGTLASYVWAGLLGALGLVAIGAVL